MNDLDISKEILDYRGATIFKDLKDSNRCVARFVFDIVEYDFLKPFILLDYFPTDDIYKEIVFGYCLTSDIKLSLSSRIKIISRLLSSLGNFESFLQTKFKVNNAVRGTLNSIQCDFNVKDLYVICAVVDPSFQEQEYHNKMITLFNVIESYILSEMKIILQKISGTLEDKRFIDFELSVIDQKTKFKGNLPDFLRPMIKAEAKRRLTSKVVSLYKRMS